MKKNISIKTSCFLLAFMVATYTAIPAFAAETTMKDETVYVNLTHSGSVDAIYVVNSFEHPADSKIVDSGDYFSVTNLTTNEDIATQNGVLTASAPEGKFYYKGELKGKAIPWNISVAYKLDGKDTAGADLAGKSGRLQIELDIRPAANANPVFTDNYAVQASLAFDGSKCGNIDAPGSTMANAGKNKQVSYIILPGKSGSFVATADVTDFEFDGISVNMIPLSIGFDIPDTGEMKDKFRDMKDGVVELDDGVGDLLDGVVELDDGVRDLLDGVSEFDDGVVKLDDGVLVLRDGVRDLADGVGELADGAVDLRDGSSELLGGAREIRAGADSLADGLEQISAGANTFGAGLAQLDSQSAGIVQGSTGIAQGLGQLAQAVNAFGGQQAAQAGSFSARSASVDYLQILDGLIAEYEALLAELNGEAAGQNNSTVNVLGAETQEESPDEENNSGEGANDESGTAQAEQSVYYVYSLGDSAEAEILEQTLVVLTGVREQYAAIAGMSALQANGLQELAVGINTMAQQYGQFDAGVAAYMQGVGEMNRSYGQISGGIAELSDGARDLDKGVHKFIGGMREFNDGVYELQDGVTQLHDGTLDMYDGVAALRDGTVEMKDGTAELRDGVAEMKDGTVELRDGVAELKDGTYEFRTETADIDSEIDKEIDKMLDEYRNNDFRPVSFVNESNSNVDTVQFIMKTAPIKAEKEEQELVEEEPKLTLWDRFIRLFISE